MAATVGKDGGMYVGGSLVTFIDGWNLSRGKQVEDITAYGDDFDKVVGTVRNWTATFNGTLDRSDAQQAALMDQLEDGAEAYSVVRLATERGSDYWEGSCVVESDSIDSSVKGKVSISGTLRGHDAIVYTSV